MNNIKSTNYDVIVVGAGASGITASLAAIEKGAKILLIEKSSHIGGISKYFVGGGFAVETKIQKDIGYDIKKEEALQKIIEYSNFLAYAPLQKAIIYKSAYTIEWLDSYGVKFRANPESPQLAHRDDPMKWQNYHWYEQFGKKIASMDILYNKLIEMGLETAFNLTVTKIIKSKEGSVIGVKCDSKEGQIEIRTKAVILATGGYSSNPEMMNENFHTPYIGGMGNRNTGLGLKLAWEAGAAKWDMQSALLHGIGVVPSAKIGNFNIGNSPFNQILRSPLMWIDQSGNRFCNEEVVYDTAFAANAGYSVGGRFYILVDSNTLKAYTEGKQLVMDSAVGGPNMNPADFIELAEEGVSQGIEKGAWSLCSR